MPASLLLLKLIAAFLLLAVPASFWGRISWEKWGDSDSVVEGSLERVGSGDEIDPRTSPGIPASANADFKQKDVRERPPKSTARFRSARHKNDRAHASDIRHLTRSPRGSPPVPPSLHTGARRFFSRPRVALQIPASRRRGSPRFVSDSARRASGTDSPPALGIEALPLFVRFLVKSGRA